MLKPCLHPSIVRTNELNAYLDLAQANGYETVDADLGWLQETAKKHGEAYLREQFHSRGLTLASFGLPVDVHGDESTFQADLARLPEHAERCLSLGATRCCTWLWPSIDDLPVPYASRLARRFRECANVLSAYGTRLGLEFVGPHHLRNKRYPFVQNLSDLLAYLEAVDASNVGILMDSYHWYTAQVPMSEMLALRAHQIVHVHINDADLPPAEALDGERLPPGDGQIDLAQFLRALDMIGYTGPVSLEVLHSKPLAESEGELVARAYRTLTQQIEAIRKETVQDV